MDHFSDFDFADGRDVSCTYTYITPTLRDHRMREKRHKVTIVHSICSATEDNIQHTNHDTLPSKLIIITRH